MEELSKMFCDKNCVANLNGKCCVEECRGQFIGFSFRNTDKEQRARLYEMASIMFKEDFKEES